MTKNSFMRKIVKSAAYKVIGTIAGVALAGMISITAFADTPGTVTGDRVNVRSEANTTSTVLTKVAANESVTILEETTGSDGNKWYKIKTSGGTTGFVRADYVKSGTATTTTTTTTTTTDTPNVTAVAEKTAYIKGTDGTVNIRKGPSTTSDLVASAQAKSEITITGETTAADGYKWYQIKFTANGQSMTGFVRSDLITYTAPETDTTPATTTVEGGTETNPDNPDATGEGGEGEGTGEGGEVASEPASEPASSQTATTATLQFLEPVGEPANVPSDYEKVDVMMGDQVYSAWAKGDYYIVYGISGNSDAQWYVYDYKNNSFVSYDGLFTETDTKKKDSSNLLIPLIIAAALAAIFLITTIFFAIKAFSGRDEYDDNYDIGYDDDEEDEGDDYEEFDDDDDYEEKPAKTKRVIVPKKAEKPAKREEYYEDEDDGYYDEDDEYEDEDEYEKPSKASKKKAKKEKKSFKNKILDYFTVQEEDDEEDDEYEDEDEYDEDEYDDDSTGDINFIDL